MYGVPKLSLGLKLFVYHNLLFNFRQDIPHTRRRPYSTIHRRCPLHGTIHKSKLLVSIQNLELENHATKLRFYLKD